LKPLDRYKYVSHKLLRWFVIYFLGAGGVLLLSGLLAASAWTAFFCVIAALVIGGVVLLAWPGPFAAMMRDIIIAFTATGLGVMRSLRGERFQTWEPPASARQSSFKAVMPWNKV
jgi:hypothetical protein